MFLRLLSELAVCGDRFPVFPVNAPSLLCDLIWHNPGRLGPPNTKEVNAAAAADAAAACGGVFLFNRWEFDMPRGRKNEALLEERGPVFIALIAKHNLQTEPWGN